jgi:transcriptional regulator with XRE-family HTH domain
MRVVFPAESPQLGETLRRRRLERGLALDDAARELGVPAKILRAIEWDRRDLLARTADVEGIERRYRAFLGLEVDAPSPPAEATPPRRGAGRNVWIALLAGFVPLVVVALAYLFQEVTAGGDSESGRQLEAEPRLSLTLATPGGSGAATSEDSPSPPGKRGANLVITAEGGDSWVEARAGSRAGPVLFQGTLRRGRKLRLTAERIWVRLGAASNLSLAVNGRPAPTDLQGTLDVLVTPKGIRPA